VWGILLTGYNIKGGNGGGFVDNDDSDADDWRCWVGEGGRGFVEVDWGGIVVMGGMEELKGLFLGYWSFRQQFLMNFGLEKEKKKKKKEEK